MAGKYHYLTTEDREKIKRMWQDGERVEDIAAALGVSTGAIYKELHRGWDGTMGPDLRRVYDPVLAENRFRAVLSERGRRNASKKEGVTA
ncbi:MAG: helix-turn-helix domain-containing protein [Roseburia sp.]|nr:helix-turn-helix domain-containing protein [Roseburia sp.]